MYAPVSQGGLNMINIKNILSTLHVKWIDRLCKDAGLSWLRLIWPKILDHIPPMLISGLMGITEPTLHSLSPFYCSAFRSFVYVNDLFYSQNWHVALPYNLYGTHLHPKIKHKWVQVGLLTVADLPLDGNCLSYDQIWSLFNSVEPDLYLFCSSLQKSLALVLPSLVHGTPTGNPAVINQMTPLLQGVVSSFFPKLIGNVIFVFCLCLMLIWRSYISGCWWNVK